MKFTVGFTVEEDPQVIDRLNRSENYRVDMLNYIAELLASPWKGCKLKIGSSRTIEIQAYLPPQRGLFDDIADEEDETSEEEHELEEQEA